MQSGPPKIESSVDRSRARRTVYRPQVNLRWTALFAGTLLGGAVLLSARLRAWFVDADLAGLYLLVRSAGLAVLLTPWVMAVARRFVVLDFPSDRKVHANPTPLCGGWAIYLAFLVSMVGLFPANTRMVGLLLGASLLVVVGTVDDLRGLSARFRLLVQIIAALIVMKAGIHLEIMPDHVLGLALETFLTLLWIVGITNAFNFFDGMDGLSTGISLIVSVLLALAATQRGQMHIAYLALITAGACAGFLPYNFKLRRDAAIFLGDGGSHVLGFILACLAIMGEWAENNLVKALSPPVLIFGVLIFDMVYITVVRVVNGRVRSFADWLRYVGMDHLHHRLAAAGLSKKQSVVVIFFLMSLFGAQALFLHNDGDADALLAVAQMAIILTLISFIISKGATAPMQSRARFESANDKNTHGHE